MSDEKTAILIRALEASGSDREAQLARAILGDPGAQTPAADAPAAPAPAAAPVTPDNPQLADVGVAGEQAAGPMPPPGKAPLRTYADVEALSDAEFDARHAEIQAVLRAGGQ